MNQALQIEKIPHDGYFAEDLGTTRLLNHYHKFYFYFNISQIESSFRHLWTNTYILNVKHGNFSSLVNILEENCLEIEQELSKFNFKSKRAIDALGSGIRFITGNLDQNDLKEINSHLNSLFTNQKKLITQMSKYTSFANHITNRYVNDLKLIQENINTTFKAINTIDDNISTQQLYQYNIHLSNKLLSVLRNIQRTISLAFNGIVNIEIISTAELKDIVNHLKLIYRKEELLELDALHLIKMIEFSKFRVISLDNIITCILFIPILYTHPFEYQKSTLYLAYMMNSYYLLQSIGYLVSNKRNGPTKSAPR
ncbi:hypothetical protein HHI36_022518 [Cryptolaemus montrouzieri]|uniref:Gustatory receptor n=1 Tax=Cryptolaemus montrouzieri TaxID=559131 RepID=A0ABD2N095_9CUCU